MHLRQGYKYFNHHEKFENSEVTNIGFKSTFTQHLKYF